MQTRKINPTVLNAFPPSCVNIQTTPNQQLLHQGTSKTPFFMKPFDKSHLSELEPTNAIKLHSAIKKDLFAGDQRRRK